MTWIYGIEVWDALHEDRRRALLNAELAVACSQFTITKFEALHGPLPAARVCWLSTEDDEAPVRLAAFAGPPTVLCVGRIELDQDYKGHREMIAAWADVVAAVPDARLVFVGGGDGVSVMRKLAQSSAAGGNIDILGFVAEERLPELYQSAHVFAMPSRNEGFGIVYAEAMRFGVPVIASVHDAGQEVNVHGETGLNVDMDDPADLTRRIIELLSDRSLCQRFGAAGFARWDEHFRYSAFARRLKTCLSGFLHAEVSGQAR